MANSYKIIDETKWERAMHCAVFRNSVEPAFCVTFEADVSGLKKYGIIPSCVNKSSKNFLLFFKFLLTNNI